MEQLGRLDARIAPQSANVWFDCPAGQDSVGAIAWDSSATFIEPLQAMLDGLADQVCVVAPDGTIVLANEAWQRVVAFAGFDTLAINGNYHEFVADAAAQAGNPQATAVLAGLREIYAGERSSVSHRYDGTGRMEGRSFAITLTPVAFSGQRFIFVSRSETTELLELRRQRRSLGNRLLHAQEDERRRMARELHDSTSQLLVGLQLNLMRLQGARSTRDVDAAVDDCGRIVQSLHTELRAFAFLAHPPALEHQALDRAIEELARGFAARTGLQIETVIEEVGKLPKVFETTLYRLTQEALTNVHRHARAERVWILFAQNRRCVYLQVRDDGVGMDGGQGRHDIGVGIASMRERIAELGGRLAIRSSRSGTRLVARIPWEQD